MKLDRLVLVNWGQIRPGDYDMGELTLLTGQTGSGKSTMLDALQTVMTAAYKGIFNYNPGQDEVSQDQRRGKTKRTLESYVVGAEYSRFSRPDGAQCFLAAVFRPGEGEEGRHFTALVAAAARVEGTAERRSATLERLELFIVEEAALTVGDFLEDADAGEWVAVERIHKRLKARYARVTSYGSLKRDYLCALYGHFRGRQSIPFEEASNAARAWCQSIAYRPIGSVHELVRDEILEFDAKQLQEDIERISGLMRQVTHLKNEGERLDGSVKRLSALKGLIASTTSAYEEQVQADLLLARLHIAGDDERLAAERERIRDDQALIEKENAKAAGLKARRKALDDNRVDLAARKRGITASGEKEQLEQKLAAAGSAARQALDGLAAALRSAALLDNAARQLIARPVADDFPRLRASIAAVAGALEGTELERLARLAESVESARGAAEPQVDRLLQLASAFENANTGVEALHEALVGGRDNVITAVVAESTALEQRLDSAKATVRELAAKKARLASGGGNYNRDTVLALERIREHLPQANVQVLCDLIEPLSDDWQAAIEGYLDGARFNLVVNPDSEAETTEFVQSRGLRSRVIQGELCRRRADLARVPSNSIIHELRSDNPIAQAYLVEQYGSVVKVETTRELRQTPRGLMKDGKGSGSRTMFPGEKRELVFGLKARERALEDTGERLLAAEAELARLQERLDSLDSLRRPLMNLRAPVFDVAALAPAAGAIDQARRALQQLDLTEVRELEVAMATVEAEIARQDELMSACERAVTLAGKRIEDADRLIQSLLGQRDARLRELECQIGRLKQLCEANPQKTYTVLSGEVEERLQDSVDLAALHKRLELLRVMPAQLLGEVRESLGEYNAQARSHERFGAALPHQHDAASFDAYYAPLVALARSVGELLGELESVGLYSNRAKLEEAEKSFHDVFTKGFCVEIKSKVDDGVRTLRHLNAELQNLKFGADRFSIDWSKWEPEFEEYYGFFRAVTELADSPEAVDLFSGGDLSARHAEVRDRLVKLLLDDDHERASRELQRIADYRNYRRYEIWNESDSGGRIPLSTWGTGSGGQLETPAYIVRAAVVTNRLKFFDKGESLKLLVNDESFSKMDEQRARAVLRFLRDNLGLQVISAMPTKAAGGLRDEFNREYSFTRASVAGNGELDFVSDCDERVLKPDAMRALWEAQRSLAREQAKLVFEAEEGA